MLTFIIYYSQTDSQLKQINQTVKITMQYYTARDEKSWVKALFYISFMLNNSLNAATRCAPNEVNFGMKIKDPLIFINIFISKEWKRLHSYQKKETEENIAYANLMAKKYHDKKHKSIKFNVGDKVYLNLHQGYKFGKNDSHCKLEVQHTGFHRVLK